MCCIYGFIKWSLSCLQRSLTFVLGFWVVATMLYALALGLSAGVAFGYDYGLAEYKTLARPEVQFTVRPRKYVPEVLARRSGSAAGMMAIGKDEYVPKTGRNEALGQETYEYTPPTLWLYEPLRKSTQRDTPSTPATGIVKMYYKVTKSRKIPPPEEEDTYIMQEPNEIFVPGKLKPVTLAKTVENEENLNVKPLISIITKLQKPNSTSTDSILKYSKPESSSPKSKSTSSKSEASPSRLDSVFPRLDATSLRLDSTSVKLDPSSKGLDLTSPRLDLTSAKVKVTVRASTTSRSPSSLMRIFRPKSTYLKWRPTKPNKKFFYKTLAVSRGRKTPEDSNIPEMEIRTYRTMADGKYERLPMRHWDATKRSTEPTERSDEVNDYKNIIYF